MNADVIFVVRDGEIVEQGNHENLIAKGGKYADLWNKQVFVKPKEPASEDSKDEGQGQAAAQSKQACGIADTQPNEVLNAKKPAPSDPASGDKNMNGNGVADKQVVKTPNGHKREVDPPGNRS
jgi:hypothetical protein